LKKLRKEKEQGEQPHKPTQEEGSILRDEWGKGKTLHKKKEAKGDTVSQKSKQIEKHGKRWGGT